MTTDVRGKVDLWLKAINEQKNEHFTMDENKKCKFFYKDGIECTLELLEEKDRFYLYSPLVAVSDDVTAMRRALEANLFQIATAGSVISVDKNSNYFVLSFAAKISDFSADIFINQLCIFLTTAHIVRAMLQEKQ
ncbi:MAG: CesT family type III secretion system chaperone [Puniceicoccales bacterium]|jgi:hypothetical protein|nr:CesT family type III secretion system chaperone [Puniceicoccales bacterium]